MKEINNIITSYDEARLKESKPLWQRLFISKDHPTEDRVRGC